MIKMKRQIKKQWVAALRSGDYEQIEGKLGNDRNGRCCLGVLADVVDIPIMLPVSKERWYRSKKEKDGVTVDSAVHDFPTEEMLMKMGNIDEQEARDLAQMNDTGNTFEDIADFIDENL